MRKVARVYIAMLDPDPRNNGAGLEILKLAGVEVSVGLLHDLARQDLVLHQSRDERAVAFSHIHAPWRDNAVVGSLTTPNRSYSLQQPLHLPPRIIQNLPATA